MKKKCYIVFSLLLAMVFAGCKNQTTTSIPSTRVELEFNILREAPLLNAMGGVATFIKPRYSNEYVGYGGVVVFHNFDDSFAAYDLACPNEVDPQVRLNVDSIVGEAICPKCGAVFDIGYARGYPVQGDCKYIMRPYRISVSGYDVRVYN